MADGPCAPASQLMRRIQLDLQRFYALDDSPDVSDFLREADDGERERLLLRQTGDVLELELRVPAAPSSGLTADHSFQLVEGVSHFVLVAERARTNLPTSLLELELQAEIDKFVLSTPPEARIEARRRVHHSIYERVRFLHPEGSEAGRRYRLANSLAARLLGRWLHRPLSDIRRDLRRFYRAGLSEKIRLARAA